MNRTTTLSALVFILLSIKGFSQVPYMVDDCFQSSDAQTTFMSTLDLVNDNADLMEWSGTGWNGSWVNSYIGIPPPSNHIGCRAVFLGSGTLWTAPGEGFGIRLSQALSAGETYTFYFTYVSHGWGSNGSFSPILSSGSAPVFGSDIYIMNLPAVGFNWETKSVTFIADASHAGHSWLFLKTDPSVSSGLISSFCKDCSTISAGINQHNGNIITTVFPNPASTTLHLQIDKAKLKHVTYEICSSSGAVIMSDEFADISTSELEKSIDISALNEGSYFIRIIADDAVEIKSFVKAGN
ncbi:MAG: T9SS type A sorting domain-containing protein [Bacteroidota bacterium]